MCFTLPVKSSNHVIYVLNISYIYCLFIFIEKLLINIFKNEYIGNLGGLTSVFLFTRKIISSKKGKDRHLKLNI